VYGCIEGHHYIKGLVVGFVPMNVCPYLKVRTSSINESGRAIAEICCTRFQAKKVHKINTVTTHAYMVHAWLRICCLKWKGPLSGLLRRSRAGAWLHKTVPHPQLRMRDSVLRWDLPPKCTHSNRIRPHSPRTSQPGATKQ
jgi:hypothetical protein